MTSDANYEWLILLVQSKFVTQMFSHMLSGFNSIHDRHTKVSEDNFILDAFLHLLLKNLNSFLAIDAKVNLIHVDAK